MFAYLFVLSLMDSYAGKQNVSLTLRTSQDLKIRQSEEGHVQMGCQKLKKKLWTLSHWHNGVLILSCNLPEQRRELGIIDLFVACDPS